MHCLVNREAVPLAGLLAVFLPLLNNVEREPELHDGSAVVPDFNRHLLRRSTCSGVDLSEVHVAGRLARHAALRARASERAVFVFNGNLSHVSAYRPSSGRRWS